MYSQDQSQNNRSGSVIAVHEGTGNGVELRENFSLGKDYALKVRKPYTITKPREKWTEEENNKFLESLKLYGRAWKKIEEHVGTKTAVQIRSHAQKMFSKVVWESNGSSTALTKPIEFPPPRPKRKPTHPYPRKLQYSLPEEHKMPELLVKSMSQELYALEQDNQSPTSVLSAAGSDTVASGDSNLPNGSLSPISSASSVNCYKLVLSGTNSAAERSVSPSPGPEPIASVHDEQTDKKLELLTSEGLFTKVFSAEETPGQSIKLFGNTILVSDSHKQTSQGTSLSPEVFEVKPVRSIPKDLDTRETSICNAKCATLPHALREASNFAPLNSLDSDSSAYATPCWTLPEAGSQPFVPYHLHRGHSKLNCRADHNKESQKEGSVSGSNTGLVDQEEGSNKALDSEERSCQLSSDLELKKSRLNFAI